MKGEPIDAQGEVPTNSGQGFLFFFFSCQIISRLLYVCFCLKALCLVCIVGLTTLQLMPEGSVPNVCIFFVRQIFAFWNLGKRNSTSVQRLGSIL